MSFHGGDWVTGLAISVGAAVVLPLVASILRPLAKTAIKGSIVAYQGAAELVEGISDLVAEAAAEAGGEQALEEATQATGTARPGGVGEVRPTARARQSRRRPMA